MAYKLIVNIKEGQEQVENIEAIYKSDYSRRYLYEHALDKIQNYFGVHIKPFEINEGKFVNENHWYGNVKPTGKKRYATIVIDKV